VLCNDWKPTKSATAWHLSANARLTYESMRVSRSSWICSFTVCLLSGFNCNRLLEAVDLLVISSMKHTVFTASWWDGRRPFPVYSYETQGVSCIVLRRPASFSCLLTDWWPLMRHTFPLRFTARRKESLRPIDRGLRSPRWDSLAGRTQSNIASVILCGFAACLSMPKAYIGGNAHYCTLAVEYQSLRDYPGWFACFHHAVTDKTTSYT